MPDEPKKPAGESSAIVSRLVQETDISEAEARELVALLGTNWSSLVREAKVIKKR